MNQSYSPTMQPFIELAQEILRRALADETDIHGFAQWIITAAGQLGGDVSQSSVMEWLDSFDFFLEMMEKRRQRALLPEKDRRDMRWAWPSWNKLLDPPDGGMLILLAGADGAGKTLYAERQAESWAKQGFRVAYVHYELSKTLMMDRRASRFAQVKRRDLRSYTMSAEELERIMTMKSVMTSWPGEIIYVHSPGWTAPRTLQVLRTFIQAERIDIVVIDYLEKILSPDNRTTIWEREEIGRAHV